MPWYRTLRARLQARLTWCACGHPSEWHRHYREGTDCSSRYCGCTRFRRAPREATT